MGHKTVYDNLWITVASYDVTLPNGKDGEYSVVEPKSQAVTIVAIDEEQRIILITEERFPLVKDELHEEESGILRLPMGGAGHKADAPLDAAKAELQEETGYVAQEWYEIGRCAPMSGLSSEQAIIYVARNLQQTNQNKQAEEAITEVTLLPIDEAVGLMMDRGVVDGQSAAAITMANRWLQQQKHNN